MADRPPTPKCRRCEDRIAVDPTTGRFLQHSQAGKRCDGSGKTPEEAARA